MSETMPDPHPPSEDGVRELPEEIATAIETAISRACEVVQEAHEGTPESTMRVAKISIQVQEALTAAILSRLGEAEARREEAERRWIELYRVHRWNVEHRDGEVLVCRNNHDKGDDCDWERFVPEERLTAALARVERLEEALRECVIQIEYEHEKFGGTGSGETVLSRARSALTEAGRLALKDA